MYGDRIHSFSVRPGDKDNNELVQDIKQYSIKSGIKFNHIILEALKLYKEINGVPSYAKKV